ncbi:putative ribonuclease H-like domain-containing protein [Tanacetum coccineum]|uniref:Ribonuclease H-like domain-containing protein n=1 Tax=Tanacetum coccineum TaxID=301880 RepID=A0ABQ5AZY6_9ASTR
MRNKSDLDILSMDDLYNNLKVCESEIKGQTSSSLNSQNVAFVSSDNSNNTNETFNTAHSVSAASSKDQASTASYADDVMFYANQSKALQLDNEDLKQIDADDIKEMDLKWQVIMLTMKVKRRGHLAIECKAPRNQGNRNRDDPRRNALVDTSTTNALVVQDGIVQTLRLSNRIRIIEARIVIHEKNEAVYEENIAFLKYDVQVKDISIKDLKNHQISAKDKNGLGYDSQMNESELNNIHMNKSEVVHSVFNSRESDVDDSLINYRFKTGEGFYAVPAPYTGNYMPPRPDLYFVGLDESVFQSAVRKTTTSVPETKTSISKTSKDIVEKPKTVRLSAPIIEELDTDSDNDSVFRPKSDQTKPKFTKINFVKFGENVKSVNKENTHRQVEYPTKSQSPRGVNNVTTTGPKAVVSATEGNGENVVKSSACWIWRPKGNVIDHISKDSGSYMPKRFDYGNPQYALQDQGIFDSGCSRHMTGNKFYLSDYQDIDGGFVAFGGSSKGGKITGKGKIRTGKLDFEDVYFVKELKFNLFSVSQMCDKKNSVLFTETECLVLSPDFKLLDESQVLLKIPRQNNMYSFDLKNVVPSGDLTCLFAKATIDESNLWHRRLGHINFKTMNKLVRGNLVRGLPSKLFENDHTCVACQKGKQHKASCKTKTVSSICKPLQLLHMDLFGPVSVRSINRKSYCLVVTNDFSRFSWVFFLATKDETPEILKNFITGIENQSDHKVKTIRSDNGTEFKNRIMNEFCEMKGRKPALKFMKPFGCPVTILNTLDHLGKFDGKSDDGFFIGYSINSKAFRSSKDVVIDDASKKTNEEPTNEGYANNTNRDSTVSPSISATGQSFTNADDLPTDPLMPDLEDTTNLLNTSIFSSAYNDEEEGYNQEEGINYDEVFAHVARIEAIKLFLAYASFMGFIVYQMDVKSAFLYGTIEEEVYVYQPPVFEDPSSLIKYIRNEKALYMVYIKLLEPDKGDILLVQVYVDDIIFGLLRSLYVQSLKFEQEVPDEFLGRDHFLLRVLQVMQRDNGIFIRPRQYCARLKKLGCDVQFIQSMIGSLMYLTASRPDIMFAVCACARFQVTPKVSHLHAVKRIFRYLKGQPKLGLWYPRDSPFDLEAFSDSDYAGASLDRKSTTGGCQFLGKRLISWQCKKQTVVANSTTEAEYVAAANCCGQVLWIQNQMLDYGFNFMNTKIYIDNESTICIVKNPVFHSKTKHIEIRHHFIRDSYEKKLIQVIKIYTDHNVADLLTKAFDVSRPILIVTDDTVIKEWEDRMERAATTASSYIDSKADSR